MPKLAFALALYAVCSIPEDVALSAWDAAERHGIEPVVVGSYLCHEHGNDWTPDPTRCSPRGACGPYQLVPLWARHFDYPPEALVDFDAAADIFSQLVVYAREKTALERYDRRQQVCWQIDWRARIVCSRASRATCETPVRIWRDYERRLLRCVERRCWSRKK